MNNTNYRRGPNHPRWKGGKTHNAAGHSMVRRPHHPKADVTGYVYEHLLVIEKALGYALPHPHVSHHVDGNPSNNTNSNLVVCEDAAYHLLLHARTRALRVCKNTRWRPCKYCKEYDDPSNMYNGANNHRHKKCHAEYERKRHRKKMAERGVTQDYESRSGQNHCNWKVE